MRVLLGSQFGPVQVVTDSGSFGPDFLFWLWVMVPVLKQGRGLMKIPICGEHITHLETKDLDHAKERIVRSLFVCAWYWGGGGVWWLSGIYHHLRPPGFWFESLYCAQSRNMPLDELGSLNRF